MYRVQLLRRALKDIAALPKDYARLVSQHIDRLAQDRDLRRQFAANGRALVEEEFSSALIGEKIVALYSKLLGDAPLRSTGSSG